jgi:hypothetical protein
LERGDIMGVRQFVMSTFTDEDRIVETLEAMKQSDRPWHKVYSPYPSHPILGAMELKPSRVGYFTLIGGIMGFFIGFALAIYTAEQWSLIVSGKPVTALVSFFIVGFECTILFGVLGNFLGMLTQARLPRLRKSAHYDPRFSADHFGILVSCDETDREDIVSFFQDHGGQITPSTDQALGGIG